MFRFSLDFWHGGIVGWLCSQVFMPRYFNFVWKPWNWTWRINAERSNSSTWPQFLHWHVKSKWKETFSFWNSLWYFSSVVHLTEFVRFTKDLSSSYSMFDNFRRCTTKDVRPNVDKILLNRSYELDNRFPIHIEDHNHIPLDSECIFSFVWDSSKSSEEKKKTFRFDFLCEREKKHVLF